VVSLLAVVLLLTGTTAAFAIYSQGCNDRMSAPWVALYRDADFGGPNICFLAPGSVDLAQFGWANAASSINVAANGAFVDNAGNRYSLSYGQRVSDLRASGWNDRFRFLEING
jgi:hypothetical protein